MRKKIALLFFLYTISCNAMGPEWLTKAVTHGVPLGRTGDFLLWYIKTKYVSYKYKIPFLLNVPYKHLEAIKGLTLYREEEHLDKHLYILPYSKIIQKSADIPHSRAYFILKHDFYADGWERVDGHEDVSGWYDILEDGSFRNMLRHMINLEQPIDERLLPPKNCISIALHIRTGSCWDTDKNRDIWYHKFPSMLFYITSLKRVAQLFDGAPLHVTLFTDDPSPVKLVHTLMDAIPLPNISYRYRGTGNHPNSNVLDDLQAMKQYDCLIRGMSGFAQVAHIIGQYKIVLFPDKFENKAVRSIKMLKVANYKTLLENEKKL